MKIVDAHHHLWDPTVNHYPSLSGPAHDRGWGDETPLRRPYRVADFLEDAKNQELVKSVHVQANFDPGNPVGETEWLEQQANDPASRGFPHAIVGFANFADPEVRKVLDGHARFSRMRGIRQVLNRHPEPRLNRAHLDWLSMDVWQESLGLLCEYGWSFDAQVYYQQLPALAALARRHSDLQFILDHAGMPAERDAAGLEGWRKGMQLLAQCPNIVVKLSGYGMTDNNWTVDSMRPFVLGPIEWFGPERAMFASNFPVDKLMSDYDRLWNAFREIVADFSESERAALFRGTAERIYRI